jgi:hypothetical protein
MDAVLIALAAAAGAGALWWHQQRQPERVRVRALLATPLDGDAEVVLHVAQHECSQRGQALSTIHALYGLAQDETIVETLRACGHDPEALENRVLAALDEARRVEYPEVTEGFRYLYAYAIHSAHSADRQVTPVDLWAHLDDSDAGDLLEAAGISHDDVLFRLVHKHPAPSLDGQTGDVHVVIRNDDYTTRELVVEIAGGRRSAHDAGSHHGSRHRRPVRVRRRAGEDRARPGADPQGRLSAVDRNRTDLAVL